MRTTTFSHRFFVVALASALGSLVGHSALAAEPVIGGNGTSAIGNNLPAAPPAAALADPAQALPPGMPPADLLPTGAAAAMPEPGETQVPNPALEPRIIRGNDRVIAPAKPGPKIDGAPSTFKFEEAPIAEVVHVVLGEILKVDYVLHQPIAGTVTLATRNPVSPDQATFLLESALQANGIVLARDARGTYHVGKPEALKGIVPSPRQVGNGPLPPGSGAIIVPLQYIGAGEMASILRPMVPPEAVVRVDTVRNLLVLTGNRTQAEGWLDIVSTFDVDLLKGMSVGVFPLKYATPREIDAALRLMTTGGAPAAGGAQTTAPGAAPGAAPAGGALSALAESNPFFGAIRIMPIERINSVLVVTPRAAYLEEARRWIDKLDRPSDSSSEPQLFVYPVQNGSAQHLAEVLNGIYGGETKAGSTSSGVAPGLGSNTGTSSGYGNQGGGFNTASTGGSFSSGGNGVFGSSQSSGGTGGGGFGGGSTNNRNNRQLGSTGSGAGGGSQVTSSSFGSMRVVADTLHNSVLIYGPRSEYTKIEATLRRLDLPPTQVLIEASIIEVTLNDELRYGLQWYFNDSKRNGLEGQGVLSQVAGGVLGGQAPGFSYTLKNSLGDIRAVLNALAGKSLIKVISSPSLMVLDNHLATISVGTQQPVKTSDTLIVGGGVSSSFQYKDTGVALSVLPSVNAGNIVTMDLNQTVTDIGATIDPSTGQVPFLQRQIASKVAVRSGESLVLGGLIRDNVATGRSGIPLLQDIPIIGAAFGATTVTKDRTELLVVITPRVVRSDVEIREVSTEMRDRMRGFEAIEALEGRKGLLAPRRQGTVMPAVVPSN